MKIDSTIYTVGHTPNIGLPLLSLAQIEGIQPPNVKVVILTPDSLNHLDKMGVSWEEFIVTVSRSNVILKTYPKS